MLHPQFLLPLHSELFVDNFAGGGGASTGIEYAIGRAVDHAINHNRQALGMHRINHPQTIHHCEDIFDVEPLKLTGGQPVGGAWFSPDCKHFSKAKGGKPVDKRIRGLVLVMLRWARIGARVLFMENVEEIVTWGPLVWLVKKGVGGWHPDPAQRGRTWKAFLACLGDGIDADHPDLPEFLDVLCGDEKEEGISDTAAAAILKMKADWRPLLIAGMGYKYEARELRGCDYGAPTIRKRLFMIARRDGLPIQWPAPSHAQNPGPGQKPWRTIAECIDWGLTCPSIFLEGQEAKRAKCKRPLAKATLRRIARGIDRYVLKAKRPFIVSLTHQGGDRVENIDEPAKVITGANRGEKGLAVPMFVTEHANAANQRNMPLDEPGRTQCAEVKGGHFALVSGSIVGAGGPEFSGKPIPLDRPMKTLVVENHSALAAATLVQTGYGEREGQAPRALDIQKPGGTAVAGGCKQGLVECELASGAIIGAGGRAAQSRPRGLDEPNHTSTAKADSCLTTAHMVKLRGTCQHGAPVTDPAHTFSAEGQHQGLVATSLVRQFGASVGQAMDKPGPTTMAGGGGKSGVMYAHMTKFNTGSTGGPCDEPIKTIVAGEHSPDTRGGAASTHGLVAASAVAYYGTEKDGQACDEPARTPTTRSRLGVVESPLADTSFLMPHEIEGARRVAAFLREFGVEFEGEFATVQGCVIVDIGMRMLTPRELFLAQGFPPEYIIDEAWLIDPHTGALEVVKLTKEQQIRNCGNSVCPPVAEALVRANLPDMIIRQEGRPKPKAKRQAELLPC